MRVKTCRHAGVPGAYKRWVRCADAYQWWVRCVGAGERNLADSLQSNHTDGCIGNNDPVYMRWILENLIGRFSFAKLKVNRQEKNDVTVIFSVLKLHTE